MLKGKALVLKEFKNAIPKELQPMRPRVLTKEQSQNANLGEGRYHVPQNQKRLVMLSWVANKERD